MSDKSIILKGFIQYAFISCFSLASFFIWRTLVDKPTREELATKTYEEKILAFQRLKAMHSNIYKNISEKSLWPRYTSSLAKIFSKDKF